MAGGLFGRPFAVNPKCVVFSVLVMALFLCRPSFSSTLTKWTAIGVIFILAYVGMAWYDYFFDCRVLPLKRGPSWGVTQVFKPPAHSPEKQNAHNCAEDRSAYRQVVYGLHLLVIAPLLGYVAYKGRRAPNATWTMLGAVAVLTAGYHGARLLGTHALKDRT